MRLGEPQPDRTAVWLSHGNEQEQGPHYSPLLQPQCVASLVVVDHAPKTKAPSFPVWYLKDLMVHPSVAIP